MGWKMKDCITSNLAQSSLSFFSSCFGNFALTSAFVALERKLGILDARADVASLLPSLLLLSLLYNNMIDNVI